MVVLAVIGTVYAARRRTQICEKFGIAGCQMEDFCLWFWGDLHVNMDEHDKIYKTLLQYAMYRSPVDLDTLEVANQDLSS